MLNLARARTCYAAAMLCGAAFVACALPSRTSEIGLDPKLAPTTYIEEGRQLALLVSTRAARHRLERDYIPLEIGIVNKSLPGLTVTPESLTLVGPDGQRYPAVGARELRGEYGSTDVDRNLGEMLPFLLQRFSSYDRVPSNFTPGFDNSIALDDVPLPRFSYIYDWIYFPRPDVDELRGQPLELELKTREMEDTVFVRFAIGEPRRD